MGLTTAAMADSGGSPYYYSSAYHGYPCCGSVNANVYGQYANVKTSGTESWYTNGDTAGYKNTGTYTNEATGTKGSYDANRSYDYDTGQAKRDYNRSFTTQGGRPAIDPHADLQHRDRQGDLAPRRRDRAAREHRGQGRRRRRARATPTFSSHLGHEREDGTRTTFQDKFAG
jgi:hypothetical protein